MTPVPLMMSFDTLYTPLCMFPLCTLYSAIFIANTNPAEKAKPTQLNNFVGDV